MASLREIKDHIGSVRSTLKITGAMKLVASAKLRKAQQEVEGLRPYESMLGEILAAIPGSLAAGGNAPEGRGSSGNTVAVVAISGNSSLCGAFNVNVIRRTQEVLAGLKAEGASPVLFAVGRKMAEAARKWGYPTPVDYNYLVGGHAGFAETSLFARALIEGYDEGRFSRVVLVYNHFVSASSQKVLTETYLPFGAGQPSPRPGEDAAGPSDHDCEYILEPSGERILSTLLPQVLRLKIHTVLLDSMTAEHAARAIAMQTASDNAEDLLEELSLEYNKGRQARITAEILDLAGGAQQ